MLKKLAEVVQGLRLPIRFWSRKPERLLRICEKVSLGERSSVAVLQFEQQRFLIGITGNSMSLLAKLNDRQSGDAQDASPNLPTSIRGEGDFKREAS